MKQIFTCLLLLFFAINSALADDYGFNYQGKIINPACIAMFNSSLADKPIIQSFNLTTCQHSNMAYEKTLQDENKGYYFYTNDKDIKGGFYGYKVIGKTLNNIYILHTHYNSGGSGSFSDLLFVQLSNNNVYVFDKTAKLQIQKITQVSLLGYMPGGDRCIGDFSDIKITGNTLNIKQYQGQNAIDCDKVKEFTIDLGQVKTN